MKAFLGEWVCEGQGDLTDLVGVEHIAGSMPAADADRLAAREAFYDALVRASQQSKPPAQCEHCFHTHNTCDACVEEGERP